MRSLVKVLVIIISLQACVEPFNPEIRNYEDVLVVDAVLTNEETAAVVKLSRSFPYTSNISKPETGALVIISDENGTDYTLNETSDGLYQSDASLKPVTGRHYLLHIVTSDGSEFESEYEEMLKTAPLDSVYYSMVINNPRIAGSAQNGVNIFVDSNDPQEIYPRYFKWTWRETWEIRPPYPYPAEQKSCWQSQVSAGIFIETTENLVANKISGENLYFIPTNKNKLSVRYSVLIKQSALTRNNYIYLDKIKKINQGSGGFFDPIPGELVGNIRKVGDPDYPVLGIFEASEVTSKRIFIDRSELKPLGHIVTGFDDCLGIEVPDSIYFQTNQYLTWWFLFKYYSSSAQDTLVFLVNQPKCYDCSNVGSKIKPDFWIDGPSATNDTIINETIPELILPKK